MTALAVLVGAALALWFCTVLGVAYATWRFSYQPFRVMRADLAALNAKHETFKSEVLAQIETRRSRVGAFGNEELAGIEADLLNDSRRRRAEAGQVR